jgi:alpha-glucosidase
MQIYFPRKAERCGHLTSLLRAAVTAALILGLTYGGGYAKAQVLARPGWAGSGVSVEPWWRRAVIYRVDPERFQDSNMDGTGDVQGLTKRLDYLQSLGVDAILIDHVPPPPASPDPNMPPPEDGFDDLFRAAAAIHMHVMVDVGVPAERTNVEDAAFLARARMWLSRGAAGLYLPTAELVNATSNEAAVYFVQQLRSYTDSMPGEHVLVVDQAPDASSALADAEAKAAQMMVMAPLELKARGGTAAAADLRGQLTARLGSAVTPNGSGTGPVPVLWAARVDAKLLEPPQAAGLRRSLAVMMLGSRTAVMIEYGQELGLQPLDVIGDRAPVMQWTPGNVTELPAPPTPVEQAAAPSKTDKYASFHPYVKPLPRNLLPPPKLPDVVVGENPPPADVNMLPGFTGGTRDAAVREELEAKLAPLTAANAATANVAMEDDDRHSMLTLYRRLIQLHHANASLRSGAQMMDDADAAGAVVWVRQPPPGTSTATVLAVCNMSGKPLELPLREITPLHVSSARLRDLQPNGVGQQAAGRDTAVSAPAYGVVLVSVEGATVAQQAAPAPTQTHRGRRRHRRS